MPALEIEALLESAELNLDMGNYDNAIHKANDVLKICDCTDFNLYEPEAELVLAKAYLAQGRHNPSQNLCRIFLRKSQLNALPLI